MKTTSLLSATEAARRAWKAPTEQFRSLRRRLHRLCACAPRVLHQWWTMSRARWLRGPAASILNATHTWLDVDAGADLTRAACDRNPQLWRLDAAPEAHCAIDVSHVRRIDSTGLAVLTRGRWQRERAGRRFVLVSPSKAVRAALTAASLVEAFEEAATIRHAHDLAPAAAVPQQGTTRSLAWCGEIITANADDVWQMTSDYVRTFSATGATLVVVDLTRLRTIDAAGAALMLRVKQWARGVRVEILFAHPQPRVLNVLRVARLDRLLLEGSQ